MDNFVVSARKYRPATFVSVVGQGHITSTLKNAIARNQLAHAYLFCGPRGVGKTTCARIFAKAINCLSPVDDEACGECESCRSFNEGRSFNIHELDAASNNSVDDIRSLTEQVRIPPQIGRYSVYIIDEVHMLSAQAFNAFLKTLEEPPAHAVFILATTEKHKIIPTILSRCQIFDFNRIRVEDAVGYLRYIAGEEGVTTDDESLHLISLKADGGMRDALSMFDKAVSFCGSDLKFREVAQTLNVLDYDTYFNITSLILAGDYPAVLTMFDEVLRKGFSPQSFAGGLNGHFRDLLMSKNPQTLPLLEISGMLLERYKQQGAECPTGFLFEAIAVLTALDGTLRTATSQRLNVELGLMKLCGLGQKKNDAVASGAGAFAAPDKAELPPLKKGGAPEVPPPAKSIADNTQGEPAKPDSGVTPPKVGQAVASATLGEEGTAAVENERPDNTREPAAPEVESDTAITRDTEQEPKSNMPDQAVPAEANGNGLYVVAAVPEEPYKAEESGKPEEPAEAQMSAGQKNFVPQQNEPEGTRTPEAPPAEPEKSAQQPEGPARAAAEEPANTSVKEKEPAESNGDRQARKSILAGNSIGAILNQSKSLHEKPAEKETEEASGTVDPECARKIAENRTAFLNEIHKERPRIAMALEDMVVAGNSISVSVPSETLYEEIMRNRTEILMTLAELAGIDGRIDLTVEIREDSKARKPIKVEDKLKFLTEKNPALTTLRKELNLEIE